MTNSNSNLNNTETIMTKQDILNRALALANAGIESQKAIYKTAEFLKDRAVENLAKETIGN